jgi:hypothetical protein
MHRDTDTHARAHTGTRRRHGSCSTLWTRQRGPSLSYSRPGRPSLSAAYVGGLVCPAVHVGHFVQVLADVGLQARRAQLHDDVEAGRGDTGAVQPHNVGVVHVGERTQLGLKLLLLVRVHKLDRHRHVVALLPPRRVHLPKRAAPDRRQHLRPHARARTQAPAGIQREVRALGTGRQSQRTAGTVCVCVRLCASVCVCVRVCAWNGW